MSIKPQWCELIASGKKTVEIRKNKPNLEVPFKVYIYCTKDNTFADKTLRGFDENGKAIYYRANKGKVIGEFVCDRITSFGNVSTDKWEYLKGNVHEYHKKLVVEKACLTEKDLLEYGGKFGWHITDLIIYDEPRELVDFATVKEVGGYEEIKLLTRPPQSWCYIEEVKSNER